MPTSRPGSPGPAVPSPGLSPSLVSSPPPAPASPGTAGEATCGGGAVDPTPSPSPRRAMRPYLVPAAIVGTQLMILLDATVVNVALPGIRDHLGLSATGLSWVANACTVAFGGLLLFTAAAPALVLALRVPARPRLR